MYSDYAHCTKFTIRDSLLIIMCMAFPKHDFLSLCMSLCLSVSVWFSLCVSVSLSACLSVSLSICLSLCVGLPARLPVGLPVSRSVFLSVDLPACLSVGLPGSGEDVLCPGGDAEIYRLCGEQQHQHGVQSSLSGPHDGSYITTAITVL